MQTVTSADGTRIAYEEYGSGRPLVAVHGSSETRHSWDALRPFLADDFRLIVPDRRGRGDSGDSDEYSLAREVEDLRAVVEAVDGDPSVFGHSFGGLVTLAAVSEIELDRLVLYEPAMLVEGHNSNDLAARMRKRLHAGDREEAMALFYRDGAGIPEPEQLPIWPDRIDFDLTETAIREQAASEAYDLPTEIGVGAPTLLLTGEHSPPYLRDGVRTLSDRVPESRTVALDGAGHVGVQSAPETVAAAVRSFCRETDPTTR